jgi:hypothetical protein
MQATDLLPRDLAMSAVGKVRLVEGSLLRRKIAVKIECHVFF